ncbi:MAG: hypothetical protein RQ801_11745, partial [Spirochaetaceae bacterium]|nr:hypothetical protein [Spirochaetaceae bacterium]
REIHCHLDGQDDLDNDIGIGLKNVHQRLKLYYGEQAGLRFSSLADEYTEVTVRIPILDDEVSG